MEYYKNAPDLNESDAPKKQRRKKEPLRRESGNHSNRKQKFTRFLLNVGRRAGILPQDLIGKINEVPGVGRIKVGRIEIMRNKALLEADSRFTPQILDAFQHANINGKTVSIEVAQGTHETSQPKHGGIPYRKGRKSKAA